MRYSFRDDPTLCRAPLLGNGDLLFPMDAEGGITPELPTPVGLPASALFRLGRPLEGGHPLPYLYLTPTLSFLGREVGKPYSISTEFSTDEATFTSVCKYDHGITVETRACAFWGRSLLVISKRVSSPGTVTLGYQLDLPVGSPLSLTAEGGLIVGERPTSGGREVMSFFCSLPVRTEQTENGGRIFGSFQKNATVTFYLYFDDKVGSAKAFLLGPLTELESYLRKTGENRLFHEHITSWRNYNEESEFCPQDALLSRVTDGSRYLLRVFAGMTGSPLRGDHPHAPFGHSPSVDLRVLSALLHGGHMQEAKRILDGLRAALPAAEARYAGAGIPGARYPYYADPEGHECLPDDIRRDRVLQTADVAVAFLKYYHFTYDRKFLAEEAIPVLRSCASYLQARAIFPIGGVATVRIPDPAVAGTAPVRPLLTSVAIAAALYAFHEAATTLGTEREAATAAKKTADEILRTLPIYKGAYVAAEGEDMPGRAPLFLYPYRVELKTEAHHKATVFASLSGGRKELPLYDLVLLSSAYANQHVSAMENLMKVAAAADVFGFLPPLDADGAVEMPAVFLDGLYRSLVAYTDEKLYIGFGLDPDAATDGDFLLPLPIGGTVDGRVRDGRFVSLRVHRNRGSNLRGVDIVMPKWLYADGAAVAVKKTERGGVMYMSTVVH